MKLYLRSSLTIILALLLMKCVKPDDYKEYLNYGQSDYPGIMVNPRAYGGFNRAKLVWSPSADQTITRYVIYWNNRRDSVMHTAQTTDPNKLDSVLINNLSEENNYTLTAYSYNAQGVRSILTNINNVRVYGNYYRNTLNNRAIQSSRVSRDTLYTTWFQPDTVNVTTMIKYTNLLGTEQTSYLSKDSSTIALPQYKRGTYMYYLSSYKPNTPSPDTFYVVKADSLRVP